ncbi:F-box protein [Legionella sp. PATHC035]|uniref:F-box-like domain-containing protein n=1 Tax=Legionella sp. PATHC035 TaxID=2992040 RepID=UPI002243F98E|nr:F-box-like domain-containing protein [Legionella sp. PATHC035]MCW8407727.1 F-box protein [Legionella sp. PATHC035]
MKEKSDFVNLLPTEMLVKILSYLKPKELVTASLSSKETFFGPAQSKLALNKEAHELATLVAQGKQEEAKELLEESSNTQKLLLTPAPFTDYSGRTFYCTAYEYAYWAKDTHMRRMLEQQMDATTKRAMLIRCEAIEEEGLTYKQYGIEVKGSKHFDFGPLMNAMTYVSAGFNRWINTRNYTALKEAWVAIGRVQLDLPAHVFSEFGKPDRSFEPTPEFDEPTLPRAVTCFDARKTSNRDLFSLLASNSSDLGVTSVLIRYCHRTGCRLEDVYCKNMSPMPKIIEMDLAAICRLDEVRTDDLKLSLEILRSAEPELSPCRAY